MFYLVLIVLFAIGATLVKKVTGSAWQACALAVPVLVLAGLNWTFTPRLSFDGLWLYIIVVLMSLPTAAFISIHEDIQAREGKGTRNIGAAICLWSLAGMALFGVIYFALSAEMFHAKEYYAIADRPKELDFVKSGGFLDLAAYQVISKEAAVKLAKSELYCSTGQRGDSELGVDGQHATLQVVNGQLWWIVPVDYTSFSFSMWWNGTAVPGYIRCPASGAGKTELVTKDAFGNKLALYYTAKGWFGKNVARKIFFDSKDDFSSYTRSGCSFEVDELWRPHYIVPLTRPTIGFGGFKVEGVVDFDPQTGAMHGYKIANVGKHGFPDWIDHVIPERMAHDYLEWKGKYGYGGNSVNRWYKALTLPTDRVPAEKQLPFVKFGGRRGWFIKIVTDSMDYHPVFSGLFMDSRSGEVFCDMYSNGNDIGGAVQTAQDAMGAKSQACKFLRPEFEVIHGTRTWRVAIVDRKTGVTQAIALVSVADRTKAALGDTYDKALAVYRAQLGVHVDEDTAKDKHLKTITGIVHRRGAPVNGRFQLKLVGNNTIFSSNGQDEDTRQIALAESGDTVEISFVPDDSAPVDLTTIKVLKWRKP